MLVKHFSCWSLSNDWWNDYGGSLSPVNHQLFFPVDDGLDRGELWQTDGTPAGTALVKDINNLTGDSGARFMTAVNGRLWFAATDGISGQEVWQSDGTTAGTVLFKDINPGAADSDPGRFFVGTTPSCSPPMMG